MQHALKNPLDVPAVPTDWSGHFALLGFIFFYGALVNHLSNLFCEVYAFPPLPSLSTIRVRTTGPFSAPPPPLRAQ